MPQINISTVETTVSELNSFEVTEDSIIHGVVTNKSKSTKNLVPSEEITLPLFKKKPTAIIKNIDVILDKIIVIEPL